MATGSESESAIGCGFVQGFHRDDMIEAILQLKPEQRGEWLHLGSPPVKGQRVKIQIWTSTGDWAILTGRIDEVCENTIVATVWRTTENESVPDGPYCVTLRYDPSMKNPWVLSHAAIIIGQ